MLQAIYPQGEFNHQSAYQYLETSKAVEELQKNLCAETCNFLQFQVLLAHLLPDACDHTPAPALTSCGSFETRQAVRHRLCTSV